MKRKSINVTHFLFVSTEFCTERSQKKIIKLNSDMFMLFPIMVHLSMGKRISLTCIFNTKWSWKIKHFEIEASWVLPVKTLRTFNSSYIFEFGECIEPNCTILYAFPWIWHYFSIIIWPFVQLLSILSSLNFLYGHLVPNLSLALQLRCCSRPRKVIFPVAVFSC